MTPPPRSARVVLVDPAGEPIGALPAVPVATPWWQDVKPVVDAVREAFGLEIVVLRLLQAERRMPPGGEVTYLAETSTAVPAAVPWAGALDDQPLRLPYARPGGPAADLAWAEGVLAERGLRRTGPATQIRTWNLSSLWRVPTEDQVVWLKAVPPFFAHEGAIIAALAGGPVPRLLGHDGGRILMAEVAGDDLYEPPAATYHRMIDVLVSLQRAWTDKTAALFRLGLPDGRAAALAQGIVSVVERNADVVGAEDRASLQGFTAGLPARLASIDACGLADTLVHGDFHPGNFRGDATSLTLLDWGDACVGHPLLDESAFLERAPADRLAEARAHWHAAWRTASPGADPERASALLAPVAAARRAVIYQDFLDHIEPAEHPYHLDDPRDWLVRTAELLRQEG